MSGKLDVTATKAVMTTVKFAVMSVLQKVQKDGFQPADLLAPLDSAEFKASFDVTLRDIAKVIPEIQELDNSDKFELVKHLWSCVKDVRTEFSVAMIKLSQKKPA